MVAEGESAKLLERQLERDQRVPNLCMKSARAKICLKILTFEKGETKKNGSNEENNEEKQRKQNTVLHFFHLFSLRIFPTRPVATALGETLEVVEADEVTWSAGVRQFDNH